MAKQTFTTGQVLTAAQMTSLQQTAMGGGSTTAKTTSYVLVAADAGTVIQMNAAGATTITVNTALFAAGDTVQIQNVGAGVCTITAGTATVNTSATLALKQYDAGTLYFNSSSAAIFFAVDAADSTSPLTTKGDLYGFSTLDARIPIGTNNQVLTADSTQALGLKWATPSSGGKVLQVVYATYTTYTRNSTSTYADTGLTATITPSASTSKVLIMMYQQIDKSSNDAANRIAIKMLRGSTLINENVDLARTDYAGETVQGYTLNMLDSPATTSATTYKTQFKNGVNGPIVDMYNTANGPAIMILLEIGA